jgi:hypothetical protein
VNAVPLRTLALALAVGALAACGDGRRIALDQVTPQARTTIARIAGPDRIAAIHQDDSGPRVLYHVVVERRDKRTTYTVDAAGTMRD